MLLQLRIHDKRGVAQGEAYMALDVVTRKWFIVELNQDRWQVWKERLGNSRAGTIEMSSWRSMRLLGEHRKTVIDFNFFHDVARIVKAKDPRLKDGHISWISAPHPPLSSLRKRAKKVLEELIPAPYGSENWKKNPFASSRGSGKSGYTNCVEFPKGFVWHLLNKPKSLTFPAGWELERLTGWTKPGEGWPMPGDIYIVCRTAKLDSTKGHVGVIYDSVYDSFALRWKTADWGQGGGWDGAWVRRTYDPEAGTLSGDRKNPRIARAIKGWLDIDRYLKGQG